jgi:hypothetical protein
MPDKIDSCPIMAIAGIVKMVRGDDPPLSNAPEVTTGGGSLNLDPKIQHGVTKEEATYKSYLLISALSEMRNGENMA